MKLVRIMKKSNSLGAFSGIFLIRCSENSHFAVQSCIITAVTVVKTLTKTGSQNSMGAGFINARHSFFQIISRIGGDISIYFQGGIMNRATRNIIILFSCCFLGSLLFSCTAHTGGAGQAIAAEEAPAAAPATEAADAAPAAEGEPNPFAYTPPSRECDRAMLIDAVESYLAAQEAGDLSKMSLAKDAVFKRDMSVTTKDKSLINIPLPIAFHRSIYDSGRCKTFSEVIVTEGDHQYVIGTRLAVDGGNITEVDSLVTDKSDWLFDADAYLKFSKAEEWPKLSLDDRVSRQDLIDAANQYFDFIFLDKGIRPPWGSPCARLEGGAYTNEKFEDKDTCQIPGPLGVMYVSNRTFVVDEEMGTVNVFCMFEDNKLGMPDSHTFRLVKGQYQNIHTLSVNLTDDPVEVEEYKPDPDPECDREMLIAATESYVAAQEAGDTSKMNLASDALFKEDMQETTKENGMWNNPIPVAHHKSIYDTVRCKTFTEVISTEGKEKYVLGTRLKVDKGKIKEIDSLVTSKKDWLFNADDYLKYSTAEDWPVLAPDDRISRQELVDAANQYFDYVFMDGGVRPPFGGVPCARLEGGAYTNAKGEEKDTCWIPAPLGELPIVERTFVVDEDMGTVNVFCKFGNIKQGMPDSHTFRLVRGKYKWIHTLSVNLTGDDLAVPEDAPGVPEH